MLYPNYYIIKVDAYPDAELSGMYGHQDPNDPVWAKILTVSIITFYDCTILWVSRFQTETTLSAMEAETIAIDYCCWELFPIINITQYLVKAVFLPSGVPSMNMFVRKDNAGALILARNLPQNFTPCSKYYETKTIWFH